MTKKKSLVIVVLSLLVVAILSVSLTVAYMTDRVNVVNVFERGDLKVEVVEPGWTGTAKDIKAGNAVAKAPYVRNTGKEDCYVRMILTVAGTSQYDTNIFEFLELQGIDTSKWYPDPALGKTANALLQETGAVTLYYYGILPNTTNNETAAAFSHVKLNEQTAAGVPILEYPNGGFNIDVAVEAVQTPPTGITVTGPVDAFNKLFTP